MKEFLITIFFTFIPFIIFCQRQDITKFTKLIQLEVEYYTDSVPTQSGASYFWGSNYKGELSKGIAQLYNLPITRIKLSKRSPTHYISYNIFSQNNLKQLEELALASIAKVCNFTIKEIRDTCDVWKLTVTDSTKLDYFSWAIDSPNGITHCNYKNEKKDRYYFGQTFTALAHWLELDSEQYTFETDSDDSMNEPQRYKFLIPVDIIKNIDLLKPYMLDKYGITLVPVKRGIEKKYIDFHTKN
jgi:hypothetical protein